MSFQNGHYILQAFREFLKLPQLKADIASEGFIVDWDTGSHQKIAYDPERGGGLPLEVRSLDVVEKDVVDAWSFRFELHHDDGTHYANDTSAAHWVRV